MGEQRVHRNRLNLHRLLKKTRVAFITKKNSGVVVGSKSRHNVDWARCDCKGFENHQHCSHQYLVGFPEKLRRAWPVKPDAHFIDAVVQTLRKLGFKEFTVSQKHDEEERLVIWVDTEEPAPFVKIWLLNEQTCLLFPNHVSSKEIRIVIKK